MKKRVVVRLFRFDAGSDYLSYYKPYEMKVSKEASVKDILDEVKSQDPLFAGNLTGVSHVLVDSVAFGVDETLGEALTEEIVIEPVAEDRAKLDFQLNEDDFWKKYSLLEQWCDEEDKKFYESYKAHFYLSGVRKLNRDYIGEAAFVLADRLMKKIPSSELEILKIVADEDDGIWHYGTLTNIFNEDVSCIDDIVLSLKKKAIDYGLCEIAELKRKALVDQYESSNENFFGENLGFKSFDPLKLQGLNVAVYVGNYNKKFRHLDIVKLLKDQKINVVNTNDVSSYCGYESFDLDPSIFDKGASKIIADAIDSDASVILSPWKDVVDLMKSRKSEIQRSAGRDLKIEIIHTSEVI